MPKPDLSRIPSYFHKYVGYVKADDLQTALQKQQTVFMDFLNSIPEAQWEYRYEAGKWSVKELVQHVIDSERIFSYRALCFARKEANNLPGFEENDYANASDAGRRTKQDLLEELKVVQRSTALLFGSFSQDQLQRSGKANGNEVYVEGIGFIIAGHALHHLHILEERYINKKPSAV